MIEKEASSTKTVPKVFKAIFYFCAFYFFLMGFSLIFLPGYITGGLAAPETNPVIIGMIRGAGGAVIPYSLLYILIANNPFNRQWALGVIFFANIIAIALDIGSLLPGEYKLSYAMVDLPVEIISIIGVIIIWIKIKIIVHKAS